MTDKLIQTPHQTDTTDTTPVKTSPGTANVERPGEHGPLSGTTGSGPKVPPTPGK